MNVCLWAAWALAAAAATPRRASQTLLLRRAAPPEIQGPRESAASKRAYFRSWDARNDEGSLNIGDVPPI